MINWDRILRLLKLAALEEYRSTGTLDRRAADLFPAIVTNKKYKSRAAVLYYIRLTHPKAGVFYKIGVTNGSADVRFRPLPSAWRLEVIFEQAYQHARHALELEAFVKIIGEPHLVDQKTWFTLDGHHLLGKTELFTCDVLSGRSNDADLDYWLQDNAADLLYEQLKHAGAPC